MKTENPLMLYLRSSLNRSLLIAVAVTAVVGVAFFGPLGRLLVPLCAVTGYLGVTVIMLQSRRGARAIVSEGEDDRNKEIQAAIRVTANERDRIGVLRIADPRVRKSVEYFLQVSGEYLEASRRAATYSPQASDKIHEVLTLLQIYLERLDGASTDEEYRLKDGGAIEAARDTNAAGTAARILEAAGEVKERMASELGVVDASDRLDVLDQTEGKP